MDVEKIQVIDDDGNELEFEVLFTFENDENGKKYVQAFQLFSIVFQKPFHGF